MNTYHQLRQQSLARATREFNARGKSVVRCPACLLAQKVCICAWKPQGNIQCEFVLLMHNEELFKPTNTGRLIADVFPGQTHMFCWSRTEPDAELIKLLRDPKRLPLIVFPDESRSYVFENVSEKDFSNSIFPADKKVTFILLDGTWKQGGRMLHLSRWLDDLLCLPLPEVGTKSYAVRKSHLDNYLSTAEAAAVCLDLCAENFSADVLRDYFAIFNLHYLATRGNYFPEITDAHRRLSDLACVNYSR